MTGHLFRFLAITPLLIALVIGCSGGDDDEPAASSDGDNTSSGSSDSGDGSDGGPVAVRPNENIGRIGPDGQPMVGNVPLNVWYASPIAVANNGVPAGTAPGTPTGVPVAGTNNPGMTPPAAGTGMAGGPGTPTPPTPPPAATGTDWTKVSKSTIEDEVSKQVNQVKTDLASVRSYNDAYLKIQTNSAVMAALAEAALDHPEDIRWKENAHHLREFAIKVKDAASERGGSAKRAVEDIFVSVEELMAGSVPAAADAAAPKDKPFSEIAERGYLMERIETGQKWMSSNIINEERFKEEKEKIGHEAGVLLAMFKVCGEKSYDSADEDEYQVFIDNAVKDCETILTSIETEKFDDFRKGIDGLGNRCSECHMVYLFGG